MSTKLTQLRNNQIDTYISKVNRLNDMWKAFVSKETYATYRTRTSFESAIAKAREKAPKKLINMLLSDSEHRQIVEKAENGLEELSLYVEGYNAAFVEKRLLKYKTLFDGNDGNSVPLDENQRRAVVIDEQHNLVIAAAGSGKTSVLTARIVYLIQREDKVTPHKILALSFNKAAADEMKQRLLNLYNINNVEVATFHSFGNRLLKEGNSEIYEVLNKSEDEIKSVFTDLFSTHDQFQILLIDFLKNYLQEEPEEAGLKNKDEYYFVMQNQQYVTLSGKEVRSVAEKEIANFFFLNGIEFEYEARAIWADEYSEKHKAYQPDFYLPQYDIYIEHWGLDRHGEVASWFSVSSNEYKEERQWKLETFNKVNKKLVESWYYEQQEGTLIENLKHRLLELDPTIVFTPLPLETIIKRIESTLREQNSRIYELTTTFIHHAKSNFLSPNDINKKLSDTSLDKKTAIFGRLANIVYSYYEELLKKSKKIDFDDMINKTIEVIKQNPDRYRSLYDHILVDEFQDISVQRLELLKCFVNDESDTKLFCVGDDWQSINRFAGSDVSIFINFDKYFPHPAKNYLTTNYRSSKTIVDMSTQLISFNKQKIDKTVTATMPGKDKAHVYKVPKEYSKQEYTLRQNEYILGQIELILQFGFQIEDIMVLSRFNKPLNELRKLIADRDNQGTFQGIRLHTIHTSKGAQAKHVFILNMISGISGFPSEAKDDRVLNLVKAEETEEEKFEEERRLFYVALTRSKEYLYLYTHESAESIFLNEVEEYLDIPKILE